jgi:hypothetical protein
MGHVCAPGSASYAGGQCCHCIPCPFKSGTFCSSCGTEEIQRCAFRPCRQIRLTDGETASNIIKYCLHAILLRFYPH